MNLNFLVAVVVLFFPAGFQALAQSPAQASGSASNCITGMFAGDGASVSNVNATSLSGLGAAEFWQVNGNAGTSPGANFLGTTDNSPLQFHVNGYRALRLEPNNGKPNVIAGGAGNAILPGGLGNSAIGGGDRNLIQAGADHSVISGGLANQIRSAAPYSSIGGGSNNTTSAQQSVIGGGSANTIQVLAEYSTIGGGIGNAIATGSPSSAIAGGGGNKIETNCANAFIGGGFGNAIQFHSFQSSIGGGYYNRILANASYSTIGGGRGDQATNAYAAVAGGVGNIAGGIGAFVGGGGYEGISFAANVASGSASVIGGGLGNLSSGVHATIPGGRGCIASGYSSVACGLDNDATNAFTVAIGGDGNIAGGENSSIGGGVHNLTTGLCTAIPGGSENQALGNYSFAIGRQARALNPGAFVWADSQDVPFPSTADDQVSFRCQGGVVFTSGTNAANHTVSWGPGSAGWSFSSDRNLKDRIQPIDAQSVLDRVSRLPLAEWSYKGFEQRHIGPMAQDFHALFPLNENDKMLDDADLHGVELAAIQALNERLEAQIKDQAAQVSRKDDELRQLKQDLAELKARVSRLEPAPRTASP